MTSTISWQSQWPELHRARRAIVVVDVVESVRLMQQHEQDVIERWRRFVNEVRTLWLPRHGGRLVKSLGDGLLMEFDRVAPALAASLDLQKALIPLNSGRSVDSMLELRTGIHAADVVIDDLDVYGSGVNLAARLCGLAEPGQIVVSAEVRDEIVPGMDADVEDLGECWLKHVDEPVRAYRIIGATPTPAWQPTARVRSLRPTVAVIPLAVSHGTPDAALLGDALVDELIASLSRSPELTVISRLSTLSFRGRDDVVAGVRTHLHADYLVSGTLHVSLDKLRLLVELTETASGNVIWAGHLQGEVHAVFTGTDPLIGELAAQLHHSLARRQVERTRSQAFVHLDSYCLLMAAVSLLHGVSWADFERARQMLEHLIERDRHHPAPHAWLAKWHVLKVQQGWSQDMARDAQAALACTRRALDVDPQSALSLAIDGFVHCNLLKDLDTANACQEQALTANPNEPLAWLFLGLVHAFKGEGVQAQTATQRAMALSPLDPMRYFIDSLSATAALAAGQWQTAIEHARRSLRLNRTHTSTLRALTIAQVQLGLSDEARSTAATLMRLEPQLTIKRYLERSPSHGYPTGVLWSESLAAAGVPAG